MTRASSNPIITHVHAYARACAICADQQRPPSDPVVSPCTLLLNLLNRGQPRPVSAPNRASTATRRLHERSGESKRRPAPPRKLSQQPLLSCTWQHLASPEHPNLIGHLQKGLKSSWHSPGYALLSFREPSLAPLIPPPLLETSFLLWRDLQ